jgi:hypothetical protein
MLKSEIKNKQLFTVYTSNITQVPWECKHLNTWEIEGGLMRGINAETLKWQRSIEEDQELEKRSVREEST